MNKAKNYTSHIDIAKLNKICKNMFFKIIKRRAIDGAGTKQQFALLFVLSSAVLILTVYIISSTYSRIILDSNTKYIRNVVTQFKNEFTHNLNEIDQLVNGLAYNPTIKNYLAIEGDVFKRHLYASELVTYFSNLKSIKPAIKDISVFRNDMGRVTYYNLINPESSLLEALDNKPYSYCLGVIDYGTPHDKLLLNGCSIYTTTYDTNIPHKIGVVVVSVTPSSLSVKLQELEGINSVRYIVFDEKNKTVISNIDPNNKETMDMINTASNQQDKYHFETMKYNVNVVEIDALRGKIITIVDKRILFEPVKESVFFTVTILLFGITLLILLYYISAKNIVKPIDNITQFLRTIRKSSTDKLEKRIPVQGNKDTRLLSIEFNNMLEKINTLTHSLIEKNKHIYEMEITKKQSEIALLRSQINPHFLYNTLEVIRSIALIHNVPEIKNIAKSLAKIMRYSIKGYENVSLEEEVNIIKDYIQIQNIRFRNKFKVEYNISHEVLNCVIPKMTLQPIVENAICHGLEILPNEGNLSFSAYMESKNKLIVKVVDNGVGIDEENLASINSKLESENNSFYYDNYAGIGILNVNSRIKLTQGKEYGVKINSKKSIGTEVIISYFVEDENNV